MCAGITVALRMGARWILAGRSCYAIPRCWSHRQTRVWLSFFSSELIENNTSLILFLFCVYLGLWLIRKFYVCVPCAPQEHILSVVNRRAPLCVDAQDDQPCPHLSALQYDVCAASRAQVASSFFAACAAALPGCDAIAAVLATLLGEISESIDAGMCARTLDGYPFKEPAHYGRGLKCKHDAEYKLKLMNYVLLKSCSSTQTPIANVEQIARSTWKSWQMHQLCDYRRASVREMRDAEGTFHIVEDGTRLGKPAKETQFYHLVHCRATGKHSIVLPPQASLGLRTLVRCVGALVFFSSEPARGRTRG